MKLTALWHWFKFHFIGCVVLGVIFSAIYEAITYKDVPIVAFIATYWLVAAINLLFREF